MATTTESAAAAGKVRDRIDRWAAALRGKDAEATVSCYAPDAVMFVMAPPLQITPSTSPGKDGVEEWFATWEGPIGLEIRDLRVVPGDDIAFAHGLVRMHGTRRSGEDTDMWYRETLCFRRMDEDWKISHQHESVPFYMDGSKKAATDLKP